LFSTERCTSAAPVAAGVLAGICVARQGLSGVPLLLPLAALLFVLAFTRRPWSPRLCACLCLAAAFSLGLWHGARHCDAVARRTAWLPEPGIAAELHLEGVVAGAAEPAADGARLLRARVRPEDRWRGGSWITVLLRVEPSPASPTSVVDSLAAGDRIRVWARLRLPRSPGNPGRSGHAGRLAAQGLEASGSVGSARFVERVEPGRWSAARAADRARQWARRRLDRALGEAGPARPLLGAMLLGDRALLGQERYRTLRRSGMAHLVAISGLHVGLVLWAIHALAGRLGLRGWGRWSLSIALLSGFALTVGGRDSVWRAVLGAGVCLGGRCLGREGTPLHVLLLVAAGLAWVRPGTPAGAGFQLTFLAVAGILAYARPIGQLLPLPAALAAAPAVGAAAFLASAPAVAWHFGWLAPVGVLTNLAALPLCALALLGAFLAVLTSGVPGVCDLVVTGCEGVSAALWWVAETASSWDAGAIAVPRPRIEFLLVYYGLLVAARVPCTRPALSRASGALLALSLVWVHLGPPPAAASGRLEARVLDVGQGLAVVLRGPTGGTVLFDAGGSAWGRFDPGARVVVPFLLDQSVRRVELLVLSHGDVDHAGGAIAVLEALEVGALWLGPRSRRSPLIARVAAAARSRGVAVVLVERGSAYRVAGIPIRVLGPDRRRAVRGTNDGSLILLVGQPPTRLLLPGDLESRGESELLDSRQALRAEALIVAHHGSRNGTEAGFLARVQPDWAIVSAGFRNPFGHPHPELLGRVRSAGASVVRTDLNGAVRLRATAGGWAVDSFRVERRPAVRRPAAAPE